MAQQQRRPPVSTSANPLSPLKATISVEEWEAKAPLTQRQIRSVALLKPLCEERSLPLKFALERPSSRPSTPVAKPTKAVPQTPGSPRPGTPVQNGIHPGHHHPLFPKVQIQTPQQFHDWFAVIERSVAHSQESHFRAHLSLVSSHLETCESMLSAIDDVDKEVVGMMHEWKSVEESGRSLKDACERLLEERDRLIQTTESIAHRLEYFQELEHATRMLNHPGESLVLQGDFLLMVERVDVCLEYMKAHRHYREAEVYSLRFQQCLTRAMTLIRMFFVGSLKALTADVQKRISEKDVSTTSQVHLYYSKFTSVSGQLSPLLAELERRALAHPDDLMTLLAECHTAYFSARKSLLIGKIMEEIKGLDPIGSELVELTRAGCGYLRQLCTDEYNLYRQFFNSGEDKLYSYLENLCDYLYDDLRPRILHEPRLAVLCEVCTVLQALMVIDVPTAAEDDDDELDLDVPPSELTPGLSTATPRSADSAGRHVHNPLKRGLGRLHIGHFLQMILQDAQTRLFFKAQTVVQSEIRYYVPKGDDLAYPEKLTGAVVTKVDMKEQEQLSRLFPVPAVEKQDVWYPTLRKTLWVLAQLHDFVKPSIFEDIAQEAVTLCRQSLISASQTLSAKNQPTSIIDGHLFLIKHLLLLKEMTSSLDLSHTGRTDEFSVTETLNSLLRGTSSIFSPTNLLSNFVLPRPVDNLTDAKTGIDHELKRSCEELIAFGGNLAAEPVRTLMDRSILFRAAYEAGTSEKRGPLASQDFASPQKVVETIHSFRDVCSKELRSLASKIRLYLEDEKSVTALITPLQVRIVDDYTGFRDLVRVEYEMEISKELMLAADLWSWLRDCCEMLPPK